MQAYSRSDASVIHSWPLIGFAIDPEVSGWIDQAGFRGWVPERGVDDSIISGSSGSSWRFHLSQALIGRDRSSVFAGVAQSGTSHFQLIAWAVRYLRPGLVSDASSEMSCQGTPTMPARYTRLGSRDVAPLVPAPE